jgi:hypothetical protein
MIKFVKGGISEPSARVGISKTGSDSIPNSDKKRNRGAFVNKISKMSLRSILLIGLGAIAPSPIAVHCRQKGGE